MRDALADIVRSQPGPYTPLLTALAQVVTYADQNGGDLEEGLSRAQDEDFETAGAAIGAFFSILSICVSPTRSASENTALLDGFFEEGRESGFFNTNIRPIEPDEIAFLELARDPARQPAIRQEDSI
jgi:hypothetical protein